MAWNRVRLLLPLCVLLVPMIPYTPAAASRSADRAFLAAQEQDAPGLKSVDDEEKLIENASPQQIRGTEGLANSLSFQGNVSYQFSGNSVRLQADRVKNDRSSGVSGPLAITLVATAQLPLFGQSLASSKVVARFSIGTLPSSGFVDNVDSGFVMASLPVPGTYYLSLSLDELQSSQYFYYDLIPFNALQNFGPSCISNSTTLCLNQGRFRVTSHWSVPSQGTSGNGTAVTLASDTGYFWFFSSNNAELMVKLLDGRAVNNRYWFFYGALSNVQYDITVTDTQTGAVQTYTNPNGSQASVADTNAFPGGGVPGPTPTPIRTPVPTQTPTAPFNLAGTWSAQISSPDGAVCNNAFNAVFTQIGNSFVGNFSIPNSSSGSFQGVVSGSQLSGIFSDSYGSCNGSGSFTGSASPNHITISAPVVSSANPFCSFCQHNTITLSR